MSEPETPTPDAWLATRGTAAQRAIAEALRAHLADAAGPLTERVRTGWNILGFDAEEGGRRQFFAYLSMTKDGEAVQLGLMYGIHLPDPHGLLEAGTRKMVRAVTCRTVAEAQRPALGDLMAAAAHLALMG